ncbi:cytochrome c, partial [Salmonella enterica subsp. enterica]|nr:cytochrome c [Salmonella enterica subsp. enterica]
ACHMDKGQGAVGAGKYPALAKNENLADPSYPVYIVIHGQKGMPGFGAMLDEKQIAAVVDYVRTSFGNDYKDPTTSVEDVAGTR